MEDVVIKIENLSKLYRLGELGTGTISHDLNRWLAKLKGNADPFSKVGQLNDRTVKAASRFDYVWALNQINLEVRRGAVMGVIGNNGAGKSTLLKILSRVTAPTTGSVKVNGRIASLLEVGTGFHPEMTGRENIYMNGTILGMRRKEINRKLDEIVEFAGVARYLDTPTKRYSSGMQVRLAFAVAAFLEPEILIVDEVLAVGDAEFQKKAVGKIKDVSRGQGRTVLFVSHNMAAVDSICTEGVVIKNGMLDFCGSTEQAISHFISGNKMGVSIEDADRFGSGEVKVTGIELRDEYNRSIDTIPSGKRISIVLKFVNSVPGQTLSLIPGINLKSHLGAPISTHHSRLVGKIYKELPETGEFRFTIDKLPLVPNTYLLSYSLVNDGKIVDSVHTRSELTVIDGNYYGSGEVVPSSHGNILLDGRWELEPNC